MRTAAEWDAHWTSAAHAGYTDRELGLDRVHDLRARGVRRIWVPGCGNSRLPRTYAELGFDVVATDFSAVAIAEQARIAARPMHETTAARFAPYRVPEMPPRPYAWRVHDVRDALADEPAFDLAWDRHVMHALPEAELPVVARTYAAAVKPGGEVVVDVHGVERMGPYAEAIEHALDAAGCFVPDRPIATAFRAVLAASGIAARSTLGYLAAVDPAQQPALNELLVRFHGDDPRTPAADQRRAWVIYSTG